MHPLLLLMLMLLLLLLRKNVLMRRVGCGRGKLPLLMLRLVMLHAILLNLLRRRLVYGILQRVIVAAAADAVVSGNDVIL